MGQSYHTNEAVDGKVPEALSHRLVGALTPHSQCGVYDAKCICVPRMKKVLWTFDSAA